MRIYGVEVKKRKKKLTIYINGEMIRTIKYSYKLNPKIEGKYLYTKEIETDKEGKKIEEKKMKYDEFGNIIEDSFWYKGYEKPYINKYKYVLFNGKYLLKRKIYPDGVSLEYEYDEEGREIRITEINSKNEIIEINESKRFKEDNKDVKCKKVYVNRDNKLILTKNYKNYYDERGNRLEFQMLDKRDKIIYIDKTIYNERDKETSFIYYKRIKNKLELIFISNVEYNEDNQKVKTNSLSYNYKKEKEEEEENTIKYDELGREASYINIKKIYENKGKRYEEPLYEVVKGEYIYEKDFKIERAVDDDKKDKCFHEKFELVLRDDDNKKIRDTKGYFWHGDKKYGGDTYEIEIIEYDKDGAPVGIYSTDLERGVIERKIFEYYED